MTPMFESSMAEFQKVTKAYYSTVEGFLTNDPLLLNLRRVAGHIKRGSDICNRVGTWSVRHSDEWPLGGVVWESGGAPSCH